VTPGPSAVKRNRWLKKLALFAARWSPPKSYNRDLLLIGAGCLFALLMAMDGIAWIPVPTALSALFHVVAASAVVVCLVRYLRRWPQLHGRSIPLRFRPKITKLPALQPLTLDHQVELLAKAAEGWVIDGRAVSRMVDDILDTHEIRSRISEHIDVDGHVASHRVVIEVRDLPMLPLARNRAFLLTRPRRGASRDYSELGVQDETGRDINAMSYVDSAALTAKLVRSLAGVPRSVDAYMPTPQFLLDIAELVLAARPSAALADRLLGSLQDAGYLGVTAEDEGRLRALVQLLALRRPMYAYLPGQSSETPRQVRLRYSVALEHNFARGLTAEWWRQRKDEVRARLHYPPKLLKFSLERGKSCAAYQLYVQAPAGLYVDEAGVFNDVDAGDELRGWLKPQKRERLFGSYIGWDLPQGKRVSSLGARNLSVSGVGNPVFCLRFAEIPPGTLGGATIVAFSVLVTTWVAGALSPGQNVDIIAFILAFPGVLSSWVGLASSRDVEHGFRSLSAVLSLGLSAAISVTSVILFLARHSTAKLMSTNFPHGKTLFYVGDYVWFCLLFFAFMNIAVVGGTLVMRVARYHRQLVPRRLARGR